MCLLLLLQCVFVCLCFCLFASVFRPGVSVCLCLDLAATGLRISVRACVCECVLVCV